MAVQTLYEEVEGVLTKRLKNALRTGEIKGRPRMLTVRDLPLGFGLRFVRCSERNSVRSPAQIRFEVLLWECSDSPLLLLSPRGWAAPFFLKQYLT